MQQRGRCIPSLTRKVFQIFLPSDGERQLDTVREIVDDFLDEPPRGVITEMSLSPFSLAPLYLEYATACAANLATVPGRTRVCNDILSLVIETGAEFEHRNNM